MTMMSVIMIMCIIIIRIIIILPGSLWACCIGFCCLPDAIVCLLDA
jgi:hypothetical protein